MPYYNTIKFEAQYVQALGPNATEDCFHAVYSCVLTKWFPASIGYIIDHQRIHNGSKPEYIVVRHGALRNPLLIVELKRPSRFNNAGKEEVMAELTNYIESRFDLTEHDTIYGLGGIGLNWMVCKMTKTGPPNPTIVRPWTADITSDASYDSFRQIANLIYNIS